MFIQVDEMVNNIFKVFVERIMEKDWLDDYSKNQCKDKVLLAS